MKITTGTNTPDILSASLAMGAFAPDASSTSFIIFAIVVSCPTCVALALTNPAPFTDAEISLSPSFFSTGMLSPVTADSSKDDAPSVITPSTATLSPGLTRKISPSFTSSAGISTSSPSRSITTVSGASFISLVIASLVFPLERASRYLPSVISVRMVPADSKYRS